jgi:proline dehydrogenase
VEATSRLQATGLAVTLDYLGEDTTSHEHAAAVADEYVALLGRLQAGGLSLDGGAEVSVKPTAVGLHLPEHGEKTAAAHIERICVAARAAGTTVTVDMEDHTHVDATLRIVRDLRSDYPGLGCVIQSQLRRSTADCRALAHAGSRVRLCKGAYDAPEEAAFASRAEVDRSYARCLRILMAGAGYPMLATHDPRLIRIIAAQAVLTGRGSAGFEYQMLYGIRPAEQLRLAATGAKVRVYVPYGSDWYGYLVRRLAERPANLAFFLRSLASRR